jgi:hypothetical protein
MNGSEAVDGAPQSVLTVERSKFPPAIPSVTTSLARERIATAALQGLLAATPNATQSAVSADAYASRAVRYADALLEALNRATR